MSQSQADPRPADQPGQAAAAGPQQSPPPAPVSPWGSVPPAGWPAQLPIQGERSNLTKIAMVLVGAMIVCAVVWLLALVLLSSSIDGILQQIGDELNTATP